MLYLPIYKFSRHVLTEEIKDLFKFGYNFKDKITWQIEAHSKYPEVQANTSEHNQHS